MPKPKVPNIRVARRIFRDANRHGLVALIDSLRFDHGVKGPKFQITLYCGHEEVAPFDPKVLQGVGQFVIGSDELSPFEALCRIAELVLGENFVEDDMVLLDNAAMFASSADNAPDEPTQYPIVGRA